MKKYQVKTVFFFADVDEDFSDAMPSANDVSTSSSTTNLASSGGQGQDKSVEAHLLATGESGSQGQTDSLGSRSDNSGRTTVWTRAASKPRMEVVCVIDHHHPTKLADRRRAFEEVKYACSVMGSVNIQHIQVCSSIILQMYLCYGRFATKFLLE